MVVEDEEWVAELTGNGVPDEQARLLLGMFLASRGGEFSVTGPELENLLGRPAVSGRAMLRDSL